MEKGTKNIGERRWWVQFWSQTWRSEAVWRRFGGVTCGLAALPFAHRSAHLREGTQAAASPIYGHFPFISQQIPPPPPRSASPLPHRPTGAPAARGCEAQRRRSRPARPRRHFAFTSAPARRLPAFFAPRALRLRRAGDAGSCCPRRAVKRSRAGDAGSCGPR